MNPEVVSAPATQLGDFIDAYESAQAQNGQADLTQFLPERAHPLYATVVRELVRVDLEYGWRRGRPLALEHYQQLFPELFQDPQSLREIAFEEYRLRQQAGQNPFPAEYRERYGVDTRGWPGSEKDTLEEAARAYQAFHQHRSSAADADVDTWCASFAGGPEYAHLFRDMHHRDPHAAHSLARAVTTMPEIGTELLGFRLIAELGRGTFGRVFLAQQDDLANRYVALKVSAEIRSESQALAQLQHTHIVPIYSIHQAGPLQAVCMPYYGSTTLQDLLQDFHGRGALPDSGKDLVATLRDHRARTQRKEGASPGADASATSPAKEAPATWKTLEGLSYVQAILWLASKLADGLAHAHERGILHRDLKPANVLLTDDGQPMLLDFNLSQDTKTRGASAALVGGTLPYMAPEHLRALQGENRPADVRSDLYGFGVILYELLTGRHPFPLRRGLVDAILPDMIADRLRTPPPIHTGNKAVSPAVASIVRHCLEPDPGKRYQTAQQLRDDLRRHLEDRPLKYAPEPSLRERAGKWIRRHPRLATWTNVGAVAGLLLAGLLSLVIVRGRDLDRLRALTSAQQLREDVKTVQFLLTSPDAERKQLEEAAALCRRQADHYAVLESPAWQETPAVRTLPTEERQSVQNDMGALLVSWSWITSWQAAADPDPAAKERQVPFAQRLNALAESCYLPGEAPRALLLQRARLARLAGQEVEAQQLAEQAEQVPVRATRDNYLLIRDQMDQGRLREVLSFLHEANRQDPQDFSLWLILGNCYAASAQPAKASVYYDIGIALRPNSPWAYFNRGLVYLGQRDYPRARADFDRCIEMRPELAAAYVNRALARVGLEDSKGAVADLTRALEEGVKQTRVYFLRARARARMGDVEGARKDHAEGLRQEPRDEDDWIARGVAKVPSDPASALADFDKALQLNPRSRRALQNKASVLSENLGRTAESVPVFDQLVSLYPDQVLYRSGRGIVLARLGQRTAAHGDARESLARDTKPETLYQVAGIYALTSRQHPEDRTEALRLLSTALRQGYGFDLLAKDPDLDAIRELSEFRPLVEAARALLANPSPQRPSRN